jgi:hypothetical protein
MSRIAEGLVIDFRNMDERAEQANKYKIKPVAGEISLGGWHECVLGMDWIEEERQKKLKDMHSKNVLLRRRIYHG